LAFIQFECDGVDGIRTVSMPPTLYAFAMLNCRRRYSTRVLRKLTTFVAAFSSDTGAQVRTANMALQRAVEDSTGGEQTWDGLMIDLRGNSGGFPTSAVDVSSLLVPKGIYIVSAEGRGYPDSFILQTFGSHC